MKSSESKDFSASFTDEELAEAIKQSDPNTVKAVVSEFYKRYFPLLVKVACNSYGIARDDAEDEAHDLITELVLVDALQKYSTGNVRSWIIQCMRNRCLDHLRYQARKQAREEYHKEYQQDGSREEAFEDVYKELPKTLELNEQDETSLKEQISKLFRGRLSSHQLGIVVAYVQEGSSIKKTAAKLKRSAANISRNMYKIRGRYPPGTTDNK